MKKGIVITKMIIIILVLAIAAYFLFNQGGQLPSFQGITPIKQTSIKSTEQASKEITSIGTGVENVGSILEDIDKTFK